MNLETTRMFMDFYMKYKDAKYEEILAHCKYDSKLANILSELIKYNLDEDKTIHSEEYSDMLMKVQPYGYAKSV